MLDIKLIRENPELVKDNLNKRGNPENIKMLEELIDVDRQWRQDLTKLNELRHERKLVTIEIATLKKTGKDASSKVEKAKQIVQNEGVLCLEVVVTPKGEILLHHLEQIKAVGKALSQY